MPDFEKLDFAEIMPNLRIKSEIVILDFNQLDASIPDFKNIQKFFRECEARGENPRLPENRQKFNDTFLQKVGKKYLIGRYGEDRIEMLRGTQIEKEGRTIHLGIDIFTQGLEEIYAPYNGVVAQTGFEKGKGAYGYYTILEHLNENKKFYTFYGHLSSSLPTLHTAIKQGEPFAQIGDFINGENGGWSRHLHFQLLTELPPQEETPIGYSSKEKFEKNMKKFPDPNSVLKIKL